MSGDQTLKTRLHAKCEKVIKEKNPNKKKQSSSRKSQVDKILIRHFAGRLLHAKQGGRQLPAARGGKGR